MTSQLDRRALDRTARGVEAPDTRGGAVGEGDIGLLHDQVAPVGPEANQRELPEGTAHKRR